MKVTIQPSLAAALLPPPVPSPLDHEATDVRRDETSLLDKNMPDAFSSERTSIGIVSLVDDHAAKSIASCSKLLKY
jgi:hypothetical protein